ncbi:MAG: InlB B-repeat-containing protein [Coriobacteriia bacterium]|nr:InlB B-repeat-containing protein [Coriobacteriia bacterium]
MQIATLAGAAIIDPADLVVGDIVFFGHYPQSLITDITDLVEGVDYVTVGTRNFAIEPIAWRVLENDGDELFLVSQYGLDYHQWNPTATTWVPWADSGMRAWLNDSFLNVAFKDAEQAAIDLTDVHTPDTLPFNVGGTTWPGGPDTQDKVFLLSEGEIALGSYGWTTNASRVASVTQYAYYNPVGGYNPEAWWLRSQGRAANTAYTVYTSGVLLNTVYSSPYQVIRPAINLELEKIFFTEGDGGYIANTYLEVTFEPDNGDPAFTEPVIPGDPVAQPADPVRDGYVFDGWFTADGVLWDFADPVTSDMTLYAHWTELVTVYFDGQNNTPILSVEVPVGSLVAAPTNPTKAGYTFVGWWTDPTGGVLWNFATDTVPGTMTLYAHWTKNVVPPVTPSTPDTGDTSALLPMLGLVLVSVSMIAVATKRVGQ